MNRTNKDHINISLENEITDDDTSISILKSLMAKFVHDRNWEKYHVPKNLAMSIAIETSELMEHFQWVDNFNGENIKEIKEEVADIFAYLLSFCNCLSIDISTEFIHKMRKNELRFPPSNNKEPTSTKKLEI